MKRLILTVLLCLSALTASAQYIYEQGHVIMLKGSGVFVDGEKMEADDVVACLTECYGEDVARAWVKDKRAYKAGLGLTIAGSSLEFLGGITFVSGILTGAVTTMFVPILGTGAIISGDTGGVKDFTSEGYGIAETLITVGGCCALAGLAMIASGVPTMCVYKKKMKGVLTDYSSAFVNDVNVSFGPTAGGVGLTLNF